MAQYTLTVAIAHEPKRVLNNSEPFAKHTMKQLEDSKASEHVKKGWYFIFFPNVRIL